jgi:hypothetical protein
MAIAATSRKVNASIVPVVFELQEEVDEVHWLTTNSKVPLEALGKSSYSG